MNRKKPAIYIMANKPKGTLYTGVTSNLLSRVYQHKQGFHPGFTKEYDCKRLVYYEFHPDMLSAIGREKQIKGGSREKKIALIEGVNPRSLNGFTLIELIITLSIVAIISLLCLSTYTPLLHKNEQQLIFNELNTVIQMAKIQAFKLNRTVYLTSVDNDWSKGLMLSFWDSNNQQRKTITQWQWQHPQWQIEWSGANSNREIAFSSHLYQAITNGQFSVTNRMTNEQHIIVLNRIGRLRFNSENLVGQQRIG